MSSDPLLVGRTFTIEELAQIVPPYPAGGRVRPRTVARRLASILELVSRGPNGSRGRGATYRILPQASPAPGPTSGPEAEPIAIDRQWLLAQVERMTRD